MFPVEHKQQLDRIEQKADAIMAAQDDINNAVSVLGPFLTDLSNDVAAIKALLEDGGTPVDTSALNALVDQVPAAQAALDALANPPAAAPVTPAPSFRPAGN
jgi:hypothetical protein